MLQVDDRQPRVAERHVESGVDEAPLPVGSPMSQREERRACREAFLSDVVQQ